MDRGAHAESEVVGRESELQALAGFLDRSSALPAAFLLEGEAGIGKTTLWRRGLELACARSYRVLSCSPSGSETQLSFAGLGDLLEDVLEEVLPPLPEPQRRALAVALLLEDPDGPPPDQLAVARAFLGALRALAHDIQVALAVDDVQWLDRSSAFVLEFALRRLREEPVAALFGLRSSQGQAALGLERAPPEGRLRRLVVGPLSLGAIRHLLSERLGLVLSRPKLRRIHELSGGNPFFALELGRAFGRRIIELEAGESLPGTLATLVEERLAALPAKTRTVLLAASALSQPTLELVAHAAGDDPGQWLEAALEGHVIELDEDRIRFSHPLLSSAVYGTASAAQKRALHRRLAGLVADPEERARHMALATDGASADVADLLEVAARLARARGAPTAAAELAEEAVRLTPAERPNDEFRRTIAAGGYHFEAGDPDRARHLLDDAAQSAAPGPRRAQALWRLARAHVFEADHRTAMTLYRQALAEAGNDVETRIEAEAGLAVAMMRMLDDLPTAARHARAAVELAEAHAVRDSLPEFRARQALIDALLGDPDALELARNAAKLQQADDASGGSGGDYFARTLGAADFMHGVLLQWADRLEESRTLFEAARRRVLEQGDESSFPLIQRYLATTAWLEGDWQAAANEAEEGYEIAAQTGQTSQQGVLAGVRGLLLAHLGQVDDARAAAEEAARFSGETGAMFGTLLASSALGLLELSLGNPAEADRHMGPLLDPLEAAGVREPGAMRFVPDEIEALILLDRHDEAEALLSRLEEPARKLDRPSALAAVGRCRGLLSAARGDLDGALTSLERALVQHDRVAIPFERARTLLVLGSTRRRARMKRAAREALDQALAIFEELGAAIWAENARVELARVSGRRASVGALTATEERVAELVAQGLTNKAVAKELFVTDRTVEGHLTRIYAKLGIRSRSELARRFASRG